MANDTFPPWTTKVRNDPLGVNSYNRLRDRFAWAEANFGAEHLLSAGGAGGTAGEHNTPEIPREVGSIYITGGPTSNTEGFRYSTVSNRSALGTVQLTLGTASYEAITRMALQVTSLSESGINVPCITTPNILSTTLVEFYSRKLTSALGAGNTWASEDANFAAAIHSPPYRASQAVLEGIAKTKGDRFTDDNLDYNAQVQVDADLRAKFLADGIGNTHRSDGVHLCREVAKSYASIAVSAGGAAYQVMTSSARNPAVSATRLSNGICRVTFTNAWTLSVQPFITPDYQHLNGGVTGDTYVAVCPRSLISTTTVDVYLYRYDFVSKVWSRADGDFFIAVYGG